MFLLVSYCLAALSDPSSVACVLLPVLGVCSCMLLRNLSCMLLCISLCVLLLPVLLCVFLLCVLLCECCSCYRVLLKRWGGDIGTTKT